MTRTIAWLTCTSALLLVLIQPRPLFAHPPGPPSPSDSQRGLSPHGTESGATVGVDEHLGAKIPLDLTFRDESGKPVRLGELITCPTIILPVYFGCTNVCNFLQGGLAAVLPSLQQKPGMDYKVLSISFNEKETPQIAARAKRMYLTSMDTPFPEAGWRFLTGDAPSIRRFTESIGFHFIKKEHDFVHPVVSLIVTRDGTIVRYLYGTTFLPKDLTLALLEARQGQVGATIRKMVGFCFSYDPVGKTYVFNLLRVTATVVIGCLGIFLLFLILTGKKRPRHR